MSMENLNELKKYLDRYTEELQQVRSETVKALATKQQKGILRAMRHRDSYIYYIRKNKQDILGTYVKKKDFGKAKALAQGEYNQKLLLKLDETINEMENLKEIIAKAPWEFASNEMAAAKRILVERPVPTMEEYIINWKKQEYEQMGFKENSPEFYTSRGLRVRSKSEVIIANMLDEKGIPYLYEKPIKLKSMGIVHPDFTVLNIRTGEEYIWEHLGMMDDPEYRARAFEKIKAYEKDNYIIGDKLLISYETGKYPLNTKRIEKLIYATLM